MSCSGPDSLKASRETHRNNLLRGNQSSPAQLILTQLHTPLQRHPHLCVLYRTRTNPILSIMAPLKFTTVNHSNVDLLTLIAAPGGDIVGHPAMADVPIAFQFASPVTKVSMPAGRFKSARVTVTWPVESILDWDQAGLLFVRPLPGLPEPSKENAGTSATTPPFAKIGLEACFGSTFYTVSACTDRAPDWNTWPLSPDFHEHHKATIEMVRHGDGLITLLVEGEEGKEKKSVVRLVPWAFTDVKQDEPDIWVGIYASRPDFKHEAKQPLTVSFSDLVIETQNEGTLKL